MYAEIELINMIPCKKTKLKLFLKFISEYSGWMQHLKSAGKGWGSDGEEDGSETEYLKVRNHIEKLENEIMKLLI